jgi:RimJ/RimL family protein N-acetyltransferase
METPRLSGRRIVESDIPFILQVWNDERVTALVGETMTEEQLRERIERWDSHRATYGGTELFHDRSTAEPIGWGGLQRSTIGIGERLTIGYAVAPDRWGRGYATEIALASVVHAFDDLGEAAVRASILATNTRSRRVAENVGMSLECEIPHGSQVEVVYSIDLAGWERGSRRGPDVAADPVD